MVTTLKPCIHQANLYSEKIFSQKHLSSLVINSRITHQPNLFLHMYIQLIITNIRLHTHARIAAEERTNTARETTYV